MSLLDEKTEVLRDTLVDELGVIELKELTREYTVADAMLEGCKVSDQAQNWTDAEGNLCALSSAVVAANARGYEF